MRPPSPAGTAVVLATLLATAPARARDDEHTLDAPAQEDHHHGEHGHHDYDPRRPHDPIFGVVVQAEAGYLRSRSEEEGADGIDFSLRSLALEGAAWIGDDVRSFVMVVADEEEIDAEEAVLDLFLDGPRTTLRAGRFFVDFGRQMRVHVHELPTPDRPLVLERFLGEELGGTGLQLDHRAATGTDSEMRFSLAVLDSLARGGHGHEHGDDDDLEVHTPGRVDAEDLSATARVAQRFQRDHGHLQWGLSARRAGAFALEDGDSGAELEDLANTVLGLDLSCAFRDDEGHRTWSCGAELLHASGELGAVPAGGGTLRVVDGDRTGWYLWLERALNRRHDLGLLYSAVEEAVPGAPRANEVVLYGTRHISDSLRLRLAAGYLDAGVGEDEFEVTVQITGLVGAHAHAPDW